ncbi:hypothetical protein DSL64_07235 [Dyadobacter luteus]|uniref:SatD family (SatD) n=1 Tax=Dyadobacter luteus TaxID=2259619 RepID=A0A3D8YHA4_9BACT|nr:hypothetical protein [Dyadobacter luteus]REA62709.1 hypothetical protein DSL64_07235 [Dyadobacter luteus]
MIAVVIADMVNSTRFPRPDVIRWLYDLVADLSLHPGFNWILPPEIYRGDSFQAVLQSPADALEMAILARALFRKNHKNTDLRIAIGIGDGEEMTTRAGTSDGEAFRLSGHLADHIREHKARIGIALPVSSVVLDATLNLLEAIIEDWTVAQSEVVAAILRTGNVTEIAGQLSISQSAVSQRLSSAKWWAVKSVLEAFPEQIDLYLKEEQ